MNAVCECSHQRLPRIVATRSLDSRCESQRVVTADRLAPISAVKDETQTECRAAGVNDTWQKIGRAKSENLRTSIARRRRTSDNVIGFLVFSIGRSLRGATRRSECNFHIGTFYTQSGTFLPSECNEALSNSSRKQRTSLGIWYTRGSSQLAYVSGAARTLRHLLHALYAR